MSDETPTETPVETPTEVPEASGLPSVDEMTTEDIFRHDAFAAENADVLEAGRHTEQDEIGDPGSRENPNNETPNEAPNQIDPSKPGEPKTPVEAPEPEAPPESPPPPEVPAPVPAPEYPAQPNPEIEALRQQVALQNQQMAALIQQLQAPAQGQAPDPRQAAPGAPQVPDYDFALPAELMTLLDSDDPAQRATGFQALGKGLAQLVHRKIQETERPYVEETIRGAQREQLANSQQMSTAQRINSDFYGRYPQLTNFRSLVTQVTGQLAAERGGIDLLPLWDESLRDEIARRAFAHISNAVPAARAPAVQPEVPAPQVPPATRTSGTRPGRARSGSQEDHITQVVFGGFE